MIRTIFISIMMILATVNTVDAGDDVLTSLLKKYEFDSMLDVGYEVKKIREHLRIPKSKSDNMILVYKYAQQSKAGKDLIMALVFAESSFNTKANNSNRDFGLFQINTRYHNIDRDCVLSNIEYGITFLEYLIDKYNGDLHRALTHYNGGYKGYKNDKAIKYADRVIDLTYQIAGL